MNRFVGLVCFFASLIWFALAFNWIEPYPWDQPLAFFVIGLFLLAQALEKLTQRAHR